MKLLPILITTTLAVGAAFLPVRPVFVTGQSMNPTLHHHQLVFASRDISDLKRGDVVVAETPEGTSVKRIGYLEGDKITQYLWANEWISPQSERMRATMERIKIPKRTLRIPVGHMFLIGDNKDYSVDSRKYGTLPLSAVRLRINDLPDVGKTIPGTAYAGRILAANHT
ncbi:MAG: signal peptidase I [Fimbriimonas sp.]